MTALAIQTSRTLWGSLVAQVNEMVAEVKQQRAVRAEQNRIANELELCSDRDLAEMGFSRCDIPSIANGTYAR
jgi:uncharacterized protein YjiS (DUF1127 family)